MVCMNWSLGVLAVLIFAFAVWPGISGATWVVGIASILILLIAIFGVTCKPCQAKKK